MKFEVTNYGNGKEIQKYPDHTVSMSLTVSDADVTANSDGKKIVPAGTILGGGFLTDRTKLAVKATNTAGDETTPASSNAEAVLLYDVDVTHGPAAGAGMIHGFVDLTKLPEAPTEADKAALKQITFLA